MGLLDFLSGLFGGGSDDELAELFDPDSGDREPGGNRGTGADEDVRDVADMTPAEFRTEAEEFADRHEDDPFDFTVASLSALDEFAEDQGDIVGVLGGELDDDDALVERMHGGYALWLGSYLGEVLVREFGGEWARDDGWAVAVPVDGDGEKVEVFDVAARSIGEEPRFAEVAADLEEGLEPAVAADEASADAESAQAAEAEELAAYWSEYDLDFAPASLARLDELVDAQWEKERFRDAELGGADLDDRVFTGLVQQLGSYYGEVLVRALDAEWVDDEDLGTAVEVPGDGGAAAVANVFHVATDCLTEPSKFAPSFDTVVDQLDLDRRRVSEGGQVVTAEAQQGTNGEAAAEAVDVDELVAGFREDAEDLVAEWPGYDLDYTPGSLERLDRLAAEAFADFDLSDVALGEERDGDSLFLTARSMEAGGYLAEVFRRNLGGEWRESDGLVFVVAGREGEAHLDPVAIAADVFRREDSFAATYEALRGRLSVPERDEPEAPGEHGSDGNAALGTAGDGPRGAAEAFAADHEAFDLDFTPASLLRLDVLAEGLPEADADSAASGVGAYLGETFVRSYDAEWTYNEEAGWVVEVTDDDGEEQVLVLPTVLEDCLAGDATFAALHDVFVRRLGIDGPTLAGDGASEEADEADSDPVLDRFAAEAAEATPATEPAEDVGERHRAAAEELAAEWPDYDLDGSVESLVRLDALVADRYDVSGGDRDYDGDPLSVPEGTTLSVPTDGSVEAFGGYVAAVFGRHHDAEWRRTDAGDAVFVVEGPAAAAEIEPEMVAVACFAGESSFVDAYAHVAAEVGLEPPVGG